MAIPITRNTFRTRRSRRISLALLLTVTAGVVVLGTTRSAGSGIARTVSDRAPRPADASTRIEADLETDLEADPAEPLTSTQASWVIAENQKPGTSKWRIRDSAPTSIEGFADMVSAQRGDEVTLYVSTPARSYHVEAYRIGYYQGTGGRLVWRSTRQRGHDQPSPTRTAGTNMVEAHWSPSVRIHIGDDWPDGVYMLKLAASNGAQSYVPLTLRDDSSHAALVIQNSVTTWQAYNDWGGYSLYHGGGSFAARSRVVSFDRPYLARRGSADFFWIESPLVYLAERLGLDVTYWTDIDLHERPELLMNHRALVSLGHDEYWSSDMRRGALAARLHGVNLAFLGANDVYRHIRLVASPLGKDRREVNYKVASEDPLYGVDNEEVTSQWREAPVPRPESVLARRALSVQPGPRRHGDLGCIVLGLRRNRPRQRRPTAGRDRPRVRPCGRRPPHPRVRPDPGALAALVSRTRRPRGRHLLHDTAWRGRDRHGHPGMDPAPHVRAAPGDDPVRSAGGQDHREHPPDVRGGSGQGSTTRHAPTSRSSVSGSPTRSMSDRELRVTSGYGSSRWLGSLPRPATSRRGPRGASDGSPSPSTCCLESRRSSPPRGSR